ncbi:uncharacterized protein LOC118182510 [Stegodyphus dumicola]|uniref:uncharacterized protein LOC118182510 n=1 Tax=Stegodyphus dumicola TaxID=202533 RepID=UPI0015A98EA3|nr:uncharacterized protein LOC118182510 [Stegodyphus dumicola]
MKFNAFLSTLALFSAILQINSDEGVDDIYGECMENEVCHEPSGIPKALHCLHMLAELDVSMVLEFMKTYFPVEAENFKKLVPATCSNIEQAREAVHEYYEKRTENEDSDEYTPEQKQMLVNCRKCFMNMISECIVKKEMGMLRRR